MATAYKDQVTIAKLKADNAVLLEACKAVLKHFYAVLDHPVHSYVEKRQLRKQLQAAIQQTEEN